MKSRTFPNLSRSLLMSAAFVAIAGMPVASLAQSGDQGGEPPIPLEKVEEKLRELKGNAEKAVEGESDKAERKARRQEEKAERQAEREAEKAERQAEREAEEAQRQAEREAQREAERAAQEEAQRAEQESQREAERAAQEEAQRAEREAQREAERAAQEEAQRAEQEAQREAERAAQEEAQKAEQEARREAERAAQEEAEQAEGRERRRDRQEAERNQQEDNERAERRERRRERQEAGGDQQEDTDRAERRERRRERQAEERASEDIGEQIEKIEQGETSIIPDKVTKEDRRRIERAEDRRRERARDNRRELLGAAAVGAVIGAIIPELGGRVQADQGDRLIINRNGELIIHKDESALFRGRDSRIEYERMRNGRVREIVTRRNGVRIITVKDEAGNMLRRVKEMPNGERYVMFDFRDDVDDRRRPRREIPRYRVDIPQDRYIVSAQRGDRRMFRETFQADPIYMPKERYTLQEIREYEPVRSMVRRVDLDSINFPFGSAFVEASQVDLLGDIAYGMLDVIDEDPETVFLIEGHTDAVGSDIDNLVLSDRRAEAVARILVDVYDLPPENLVTQGYGEEFLKVQTQQAERANRRATVRNITPILDSSVRQ